MPVTADPRQKAWARFVVSHALLVERIEAALAEAGLPSLDWYDVLWVLENAENGSLRMHRRCDTGSQHTGDAGILDE